MDKYSDIWSIVKYIFVFLLKRNFVRDLIDICEDNEGCPIFPGRQVLELQLEPAHVFLAMLRLMLRDHKVFRLFLR